MSGDSADAIADLERRWLHACGIALASLGQPDRAENVAYRDKLAAMLRAANAEGGDAT